MRILPSGDSALVVEFGSQIDRDVSERVTRLARTIEAIGPAGVVECLPTYRSLMICYDPAVVSHAALAGQVRALAADEGGEAPPGRLWTVPACYEGDLAPDLDDVAAATGLSRAAVVERHLGSAYHVYMLGFLPGFAYCGDIDERLRLPRRTNPRTRVPAGSVAIALQQTAVYPLESPGGWHLLGRTPVRFFDLAAEAPSLLAPGDKMRFRPVSRREYDAIAAEVAAGAFRLVPENAP